MGWNRPKHHNYKISYTLTKASKHQEREQARLEQSAPSREQRTSDGECQTFRESPQGDERPPLGCERPPLSRELSDSLAASQRPPEGARLALSPTAASNRKGPDLAGPHRCLGPSPAVFAVGPGPGSAGAEPRMKLENDLHWKSPSPRGADPPSLAVQCAWALSGTFCNSHSSALHWP
ncbi:PREDICTED: uncharacterized protein LOC105601334 [Cercocebus atys]|uniref:uncharacterized protein LOC105601334 n=1 Tax=Cercocebus atys TaxID=9531 RepID=UPI0005F50806|nr:PREDICTED: uncharacterized protein LOC105601334 [Cercocebus atys]